MTVRRGLNVVAIILLWGGPISNALIAWWIDRQSGDYNALHVFTVSPIGWIVCLIGLTLLVISNEWLRKYKEAPFSVWILDRTVQDPYEWPPNNTPLARLIRRIFNKDQE